MRNENAIAKVLTDAALSRRSFLKWSVALGGTAVLAGKLDLGLQNAQPIGAAPQQSKWAPATRWHNCGGRCLLKANIVDGVLTRLNTRRRPSVRPGLVSATSVRPWPNATAVPLRRRLL